MKLHLQMKKEEMKITKPGRFLINNDKITNTLAFRVKKSDIVDDTKSHIGTTRAQHNRMLENKVKGETHFNFGNKNEENNANEPLTAKLPYGEPSKNCPNVPLEESLHRRKEAKKYMKQRQMKLKQLIRDETK